MTGRTLGDGRIRRTTTGWTDGRTEDDDGDRADTRWTEYFICIYIYSLLQNLNTTLGSRFECPNKSTTGRTFWTRTETSVNNDTVPSQNISVELGLSPQRATGKNIFEFADYEHPSFLFLKKFHV